MQLGHLHINFQDLPGAIRWMEQVLEKKPAYQNANMAVFPLGSMSFIFDQSEEDSAVTIAFDSQNCDQDFSQLVGRQAKAIEKPADQPWGVRVAYLQGPGKTTIEIEQPLK